MASKGGRNIKGRESPQCWQVHDWSKSEPGKLHNKRDRKQNRKRRDGQLIGLNRNAHSIAVRRKPTRPR